MKTNNLKLPEIKREWMIVDASEQTVGRLASEISRILRGKHKSCFVPYWECGDSVIVINAKKVKFTGDKWKDKIYYSHSTFIGGLKAKKAEDIREDSPEKIIIHAVQGMLPKNKLGRKILKNLKVYADEKHPHEAQKPVPLTSRLLKK